MLTDTKARAAKPGMAGYRLADRDGLFLYVTPAGGKSWRLRYRNPEGKEQTLTLGRYPDVSLSEARDKAHAHRKTIRAGGNPRVPLGRKPQAPSFESVAREWHEKRLPLWSARHAEDTLLSLSKNVFPTFGNSPVDMINPRDVLLVLQRVEDRGAIETAHRIRQRMSEIFVYAIANSYAEQDPAAIVASALRPVVRKHQPALTTLDDLRAMISRAEADDAYPVTLLAHRFLYLTVVRPGELRFAAWSEFEDLEGENPLWIIPKERMKMKREHLVPLSPQAVEVLKALEPYRGNWPHLFPSTRRPQVPLSENAIGYLLNRAGFHKRHVPHGYRASFSTIMNENYPQDRQVLDVMLAHSPKDRIEAAYNRALYLPRRRELARIWADLVAHDAVPVAGLVSTRRKSPGLSSSGARILESTPE